MDFSEKIKEILNATGLSQQLFADKIGVAQATLWSWLKNGRIPQSKALISISAKFNIPAKVLKDESITPEQFRYICSQSFGSAESPTPTVAISETLSDEINKAAAKLEMNRQDTVRLLLKTGLKCLEYIDYNIAEQIALPTKKGGQ